MLTGSGLATIGLLIGLIELNGVYDSFVTFYLRANFSYGDSPSLISQLLSLPGYLHVVDELLAIVVLIAVVWSVVLIRRMRPAAGKMANQPAWKISAFLVIGLAVSLYAILRTGMNYGHYFFFVFNPLLLLLAHGWQTLLREGYINVQVRRFQSAALTLFLVLFGIFTLYTHFQGVPINQYVSNQQGGWRLPLSPVSEEVMKYALPGEPLVVWGWMCSYYVEARMPQGVAENHSQRSVFFKPMFNEYRQRYLANVIQSFPPVFVDAVGKNDLWMTDRRTQGHEIIGPLGRFVAAHYRYMGLVSDSRIYARLDRINGRPGTDQPMADATPFLSSGNR